LLDQSHAFKTFTHGVDNAAVTGAAAQVAAQRLADGMRLCGHALGRHGHAAHDHARRAKPTLQRMVPAKGLLHGVQAAVGRL
jgi:hypothetical protein